MADILLPETRAFWMLQQDEGVEWDVELTFGRNGDVQTRSLPGARWMCTLQVPDDTVAHLADRGRLEAFLMRLRGGAVRLRMWSLARPRPLGGLSGSPTIAAAVAVGATSVQLTGCNAGVLCGDRLGLGTNGQRVMVVQDATPDGGGGMTVQFEPRAWQPVSASAPAVWDKPTTAYVMTTPKLVFPQRADQLPGFSIEFVESPR